MGNELDKMTAVEWLVQQLTEVDYNCINKTFLQNNQTLSGIRMRKIFKQAKEIEKQQIMDAHYAPKYGCFNKEYYKETYGGKDEK
jgi:hypothetical protein